MKHWGWYCAAIVLAAVWGGLPFSGTDVAKLQPVELIRVSKDRGQILVETDTGDRGTGSNLAGAFADLKKTANGHIFLDTAAYLLVTSETENLLSEISDYLRPACFVCLEQGNAELERVSDYLSAHEPEVSLRDYRAGERQIPTLITREGRMCLVPSKG